MDILLDEFMLDLFYFLIDLLTDGYTCGWIYANYIEYKTHVSKISLIQNPYNFKDPNSKVLLHFNRRIMYGYLK